ncbi:MAG: bifunctional 4-hydroxy-2-oxoglutarate aldolase/2-dehydro-3-deoxy-phosphogluconate aldolase [Xanthomonadaceae bacterium]|jgi:2-dehydro-3-deoxyphosphogluconate aldolase/(4S)-4-hydroxy-2-oxoglutarate aldolase|nr:bifunctional 4-hydroxy-2-oxoglutarate aldolase/2-dehydro-3-deoxy-phosphogluconate aldolase [Xanthomonadaceae bacterium]
MSIVPFQAKAELLLRTAGILPIVTVDSVDEAHKTVSALRSGGLSVIELTLHTPIAVEALTQLKKEYPDTLIGAGSILNEQQIAQAADAGADFLTTPCTQPLLVETLAAITLPCIPGAATPSELLTLMERGFRVCKMFPVSTLGGPVIVQEMGRILPELKLCPTGGITEETAASYLALENVPCISDSWMVSKRWIADGDWGKITKSAAKAAAIIGQSREKRGGGLLRWR